MKSFITGILFFIVTLFGVLGSHFLTNGTAGVDVSFILCPVESLLNLVHVLAETFSMIEGTTTLTTALCPFHIVSHSFYHLPSQLIFSPEHF